MHNQTQAPHLNNNEYQHATIKNLHQTNSTSSKHQYSPSNTNPAPAPTSVYINKLLTFTIKH